MENQRKKVSASNAPQKVLNLIIKQSWFDKIMSGEKKVETREIRAKTAYRYIEYVNEESNEVYKQYKDVPKEVPVYVRPVEYDAIHFYVGYNKGRDEALVEVLGAEIVVITDEKGEEVVYEYEGETFILCEIDYELGQILESKVG